MPLRCKRASKKQSNRCSGTLQCVCVRVCIEWQENVLNRDDMLFGYYPIHTRPPPRKQGGDDHDHDPNTKLKQSMHPTHRHTQTHTETHTDTRPHTQGTHNLCPRVASPWKKPHFIKGPPQHSRDTIGDAKKALLFKKRLTSFHWSTT